MPLPYHKDLRERVITAYREGLYTYKEISDLYDVSVKTIQRWVNRLKYEGHFEPRTDYQKGHSHAVEDLEGFQKIVEENNFSNIDEIVTFVKKGSRSSIGRALKKINYVKKNVKNPIESKMRKK